MINLRGFGLFLVLCTTAFGDPEEDLVVDLPGLQFKLTVNHYSGYLQVTEDRFYHYWFFESQNDPATDPLVLWLNGGPGCSSLLGLFVENGPFYLDRDGEGNLYENPFSWNTFANMLYLSSPACVGFSYDVNGNCTNSDDSTSETNYIALQQFFLKFPEYLENDFFVTGDSYAGTYVPTLTERIVDGQEEYPINFQGFSIGNPWFDVPLNTDSKMFYAYYHGIIGYSYWKTLTATCCENGIGNRESCTFYWSTDDDCIELVYDVMDRMENDGISPYNLYSNCQSPPWDKHPTFDRSHKTKTKNNAVHSPEPSNALNIGPELDPACTSYDIEAAYLNDRVVREILHIPTGVQDWIACNNLPYIRQYPYVVDKVAYVANTTRGLIYSGDTDMVCNIIGNLWDIEDLNLPVVEDRRTWESNGQVAGFVKRFENLDLLTVKGAGHSVPTYVPKTALQMIKSFIFNEPY